jgi:hypothetical protein
MNDEQERALLERLSRIDRRVGIIGSIVIAAASGCVAGFAYQFAVSDWGIGKGPAGLAALAVWGVAWYFMVKHFDK